MNKKVMKKQNRRSYFRKYYLAHRSYRIQRAKERNHKLARAYKKLKKLEKKGLIKDE